MTKRPANTNLTIPAGFPALLKEIKARIRQAQTRAILAANVELVRLYWDIGRLIGVRQEREGWGAAWSPGSSASCTTTCPKKKASPNGTSGG